MDISLDTIHWQQVGNDLMPLYPPKDMNYPAEAVVLQPTIYGYDDQYTGALIASPQVQTASLVATDLEDGGGVTFTISDSDPAATNSVYIAWWGQNGNQAWQLVGTRTGNGTVSGHYTVGLYACKVISVKVGYGNSIGMGNLFYLTNLTNVCRVRIRDAVANSTLKVCYKLGFQADYQTTGRAAIKIWVVPETTDSNLSMLGSEVGQSFSVLAPRQADFPPMDGFAPGSRVGIGGVWYDVHVSYPTEDIYYAPTFSMRLYRMNDLTVEIDGTDV